MTRRGLLLILSSPSGAGKSTLSRMLMDWDPSMRFSISATTRKPRPGEEDGREYYFRTREEFESMVKSGEMLEHAEVCGVVASPDTMPTVLQACAGRTPAPWCMLNEPAPANDAALAGFFDLQRLALHHDGGLLQHGVGGVCHVLLQFQRLFLAVQAQEQHHFLIPQGNGQAGRRLQLFHQGFI